MNKPKRRTPERILETALRLFNEFGEPNVTTTVIADEMNISPGNLYYHYRNKDEIVNALFTRYEREIDGLLTLRDTAPREVEDVWFFLHLLFEPAQDDEAMFFANLFSYRDRARLCEHAYQRTREHLYQRRDELAPVLARHGLQLNLEVLRDRTRTLLGAEPAATATQGLARTLDQLQHWIDARRAA